MKTFAGKLLGWLSLAAMFSFKAAAVTHYVDANGTNPVPPYTDWSIAATNIQDAVDAASDGDIVLVTNGVYATGGRVVYGSLTNRVVINKAITVQSVNGAGTTLIQGNKPNGNSAMRCVYLTGGASLIGFTLTNGATRNAPGDIFQEQSGGGVWCGGNSAVISNCVLTGNSAIAYGGGIFQGTLFNSVLTNNNGGFGGAACSNILINCTLTKNAANQQNLNSGGGAYCCTLSSCLVVGNVCNGGQGGGGAYSSTLTECVVSNNVAIGGNGGGVYFGTINNSLISSNRAASGGGAYSNMLVNSVLKNNFAGVGGGAYGSALMNCTVVSNTASGSGGGASGSTLSNCIIVSNTALQTGGGIDSGALNNCIIYRNFALKIPDYPNDNRSVLNYCDTSTLATNGFGNITNEPAFMDLGNGDFHLQSNSPCINAGNNSYATNSTDLDGNPRIVGGTVDIGAHEFQSPSSTLSYAWAQQYGLPTDGTADNTDTDNDGMNNYAEWKSSTNPTNALSLLQLAAPVFTNSPDGIVVTWQSVANVTYYLQRSSDLAGVFSSIQSNLVGQAVSTSYTDLTGTNGGPYFYRVGVQ